MRDSFFSFFSFFFPLFFFPPLSCVSPILLVGFLVTYGPEAPFGRQRWDWRCRGGLSGRKNLDTERQSALQRALNNCFMWHKGYQNGGTNWAFRAVGSWRGWGVQRRTWQRGSRINEDSKGACEARVLEMKREGERRKHHKYVRH